MGSRRDNPSPLDSGRAGYSKWVNESRVSWPDDIIEQLEKQKCDLDKLVFLVRLRDGKLIFLEEGNKKSGLTHIQGKHGDDFVKAFGEQARSLPAFLYKAMVTWRLIGSYEATNDGEYNLVHFYHSDGEHVIKVVISDNGYIVSAFPLRRGKAIRELKTKGGIIQ